MAQIPNSKPFHQPAQPMAWVHQDSWGPRQATDTSGTEGLGEGVSMELLN